MDGQERSRGSNAPSSVGGVRSTEDPDEVQSPRQMAYRQEYRRQQSGTSQGPSTPQRPAQVSGTPNLAYAGGNSGSRATSQRTLEPYPGPMQQGPYQLPPIRHQHHRSEGYFHQSPHPQPGYMPQPVSSYSPTIRQRQALPNAYYPTSPAGPTGPPGPFNSPSYSYGSSSRHPNTAPMPYERPIPHNYQASQPPTPVIYQGRPFSPPSGHHPRHQSLGAFITSPTSAPGSARTPETTQLLQHYGSPVFERPLPGPSNLSMASGDRHQQPQAGPSSVPLPPSIATGATSLPRQAGDISRPTRYDQREALLQAGPSPGIQSIHRRYMSTDMAGGMPSPSPARSMHLDPAVFGSMAQPVLDIDLHKRHRVSRACDECRRKKVRCDATLTPETVQRISPSMSVSAASLAGKVPAQTESGIVVGEVGEEGTCTSCKRLGIFCRFSRVPMKRGPSKGYIKELEDRLVTLESALGRQPSTGLGEMSETESNYQRIQDTLSEDEEEYGQDIEEKDFASQRSPYSVYESKPLLPEPILALAPELISGNLAPERPPSLQRSRSPVVGLGVSLEGLQPQYQPREVSSISDISDARRPIARARGHSRTRSVPLLQGSSNLGSYPTPSSTVEIGKEPPRSSKRVKRQAPSLTSIDETPSRVASPPPSTPLERFQHVSFRIILDVVTKQELTELRPGHLLDAINSIVSSDEDTRTLSLLANGGLSHYTTSTAAWRIKSRENIYEVGKEQTNRSLNSHVPVLVILESGKAEDLDLLQHQLSYFQAAILTYLDAFQRCQPVSFLSETLGLLVGKALGLHLHTLGRGVITDELEHRQTELGKSLGRVWKAIFFLDSWHANVFARPSMVDRRVRTVGIKEPATSADISLDDLIYWSLSLREERSLSPSRLDTAEAGHSTSTSLFPTYYILQNYSMLSSALKEMFEDCREDEYGQLESHVTPDSEIFVNVQLILRGLSVPTTTVDPILGPPILSQVAYAIIILTRLASIPGARTGPDQYLQCLGQLIDFLRFLQSSAHVLAVWSTLCLSALFKQFLATLDGRIVLRSEVTLKGVHQFVSRGPMGLYTL